MGGYHQRDTIFQFDYFISLARSMGCFLFGLLCSPQQPAGFDVLPFFPCIFAYLLTSSLTADITYILYKWKFPIVDVQTFSWATVTWKTVCDPTRRLSWSILVQFLSTVSQLWPRARCVPVLVNLRTSRENYKRFSRFPESA